MKWQKIDKTSSLSTSLIQLVFIVYLSMTVLITCIQLVNEYYHTKKLIEKELTLLEDVFEGGLAEALFSVDSIGLESIVKGICKIPIVKGVMVLDEFGVSKQQIGYVQGNHGKQILIKDNGTVLVEGDPSFVPLRGMFSHEFNIDYTYTGNETVGQLVVYSGASVIIDRISYSFFLITVNSVILIGILWAIIFYFTRHVIGKPLKTLTHTTEKFNPNNPDFKTISYSTEEKKLLSSGNELGVLSRSFDKMRIGILERISNLQEIKDLGEDFAGSYDFKISFNRILHILNHKFSFNRAQLYLETPLQTVTVESENAQPISDFHVWVEKIKDEMLRQGKHNKIRSFPMKELLPDAVKNTENSTFLFMPLVDEDRYMGAMGFFENSFPFELTEENHVFLQALARLTVINFKKINMLDVVRENTRLSEEMKLAHHIQTILLPEKPSLKGYEIAVSLTPADEVGGDYYDILTVGGYNWLVIGDVSGHGVSAGLVMMMVQTAIHTVLFDNPSVKPAHLLSIINSVIFDNIERMAESKHMTITVLSVGQNGRFSFSGLHEDILIYRSFTGAVEEIETEGMWIGLEPDISTILNNNYFDLNVGDSLILYTDGITEAMGKKEELYGSDRIIELLRKHGSKSAADIHQKIIESLDIWNKDDDVTLLVIKKTE